jgi:hypothetical protein
MNFRFFLALVMVIFVAAGPARAGVRDDILAGAARCSQFADDRQWLDCYYGAAQSMRSRLGLPPAPGAQTQLFAHAQSAQSGVPMTNENSAQLVETNRSRAPADQFGLPQQTHAETVDHVASRMVAFDFDKDGFFTVKLSNGQIWRQLPGDTSQAHWRKSPNDFVYNVSITHGMFGSFNLRVAGLAGGFKVERIK